MIGKTILIKIHSLGGSDDIYCNDTAKENGILQLTFENRHIFNQLKRGNVKER